MTGGNMVEQLGAGHGVLDTGRGDQHREKQSECVGDDAPLAADDLLACARALARGGNARGGLHALRVDHVGRGLGIPALTSPHQLPQHVIELGEQPFLLPLREVAVDRRPGREVVRQVAPLHPRAVHVEDRVHDLAQVVFGRPAEVQGPAAALEAPGRKDRLDQLPAGIGQITRIRTSLTHDLGVPLQAECARACVFGRGSRAWNRASWKETGARRIPPRTSPRLTLRDPLVPTTSPALNRHDSQSIRYMSKKGENDLLVAPGGPAACRVTCPGEVRGGSVRSRPWARGVPSGGCEGRCR